MPRTVQDTTSSKMVKSSKNNATMDRNSMNLLENVPIHTTVLKTNLTVIMAIPNLIPRIVKNTKSVFPEFTMMSSVHTVPTTTNIRRLALKGVVTNKKTNHFLSPVSKVPDYLDSVKINTTVGNSTNVLTDSGFQKIAHQAQLSLQN